MDRNENPGRIIHHINRIKAVVEHFEILASINTINTFNHILVGDNYLLSKTVEI